MIEQTELPSRAPEGGSLKVMLPTVPRIDSLANILRERAQTRPDRIAIAVDGRSLTFKELDARSDVLAAGLAALGVAKGDGVAVLSPNRFEVLEVVYACAKLGAVQVPLNAFLKGDFLCHQLASSGAKVLITDAEGVAAVAPLRGELPALETTILFDGDPGEHLPYSVLEQGGSVPPDVEVGPDDIVSILFTSGTTGMPKGVIATNGFYVRNAMRLGEAMEVDDDDVSYSAMPIFHAGGQFALVTLPLVYGIPANIASSFSATGFLPHARKIGATLLFAVGPMALALLAQPESPDDHNHSVRRMMTAPLNPAGQAAFKARFGIDPWADVYGQSECLPITLTPLASERRDPAGMGIAAPDLEVELLDDDGNIVEGGAIGEICIRPLGKYAMFSGYHGQPEATLASFQGLWYHTGDFGRRLESGSFTFVDRKKDALRRRGENISSVEVESQINKHPQVQECAVHQVPNALGDDDVKVVIVTRAGETIEPAELFAYFKSTLPYFTIPRYVEVVEALPKNAVSRVLKHELRALGVTSTTWDFDELGFVVEKAERR